jgi:7-cyano-7-deazaguanine synthase
MKKAISVFSGGLDCTVATTVFDRDYEIHAITFNYGQGF